MTSFFLLRRFATLAVLLATTAAQATTIYRWVDEKGRVQMSDAVPEKYKQSAKPIETKASGVSAEDLKAAQERAAKQKALADELTKRRTQEEAAKAQAAAAVVPATKASGAKSTPPSDCASWRRVYRESQACFAPFQNVDGSFKPGAFEKCTEVANPEPQCGVESWYK